jgi:hypothetical protein
MHLGSDGASCRHAAQRWLMRPNCACGDTERDPGLTPRPLLIDPGVGTAPKPDAGPSKGQVPRAALDESARNVRAKVIGSPADFYRPCARLTTKRNSFGRTGQCSLVTSGACVRCGRLPADRQRWREPTLPSVGLRPAPKVWRAARRARLERSYGMSERAASSRTARASAGNSHPSRSSFFTKRVTLRT